jgi:hypothetical protein
MRATIKGVILTDLNINNLSHSVALIITIKHELFHQVINELIYST